MELSSPKIRKFLILLGLIPFFYFLKKKKKKKIRKSNFLLFFLKKLFLYFGKGIFRTLPYVELEAYSEPSYIQNPRHIQNTVKHLRWNVLQK